MSGRYDRPLTPQQIAAVNDESIDFSDIPELDEGFWERAELVEPDRTDQITMRPMDPAAAAVVDRARAVLGDSLLGVVAFGSWARGEQTSTSDLDVLLIAGEGVPVSRALYRRWDARPGLFWDGHEVAPHFVRLPSGDAPVSGLWAEVARDGLILFERDLAVSRHLGNVRRRIARGELSVRKAGGQRYWVHEP